LERRRGKSLPRASRVPKGGAPPPPFLFSHMAVREKSVTLLRRVSRDIHPIHKRKRSKKKRAATARSLRCETGRTQHTRVGVRAIRCLHARFRKLGTRFKSILLLPSTTIIKRCKLCFPLTPSLSRRERGPEDRTCGLLLKRHVSQV